ncbi:MAG: hypothetical protein JXJ18_07130 [Rhodobacteraceae bacterium]|nr:hypothetical protein [Paracoccaceae bacterium]
MKTIISGTALAALCVGSAHAGGVERSTQSVGVLFEQGTYAELSFTTFDPKVSGTALGQLSGDMSPSYSSYSLSYKQALSDSLDLALILDQPIGADIAYPSGTTYIGTGATATLESTAVTALIRYKFPSNISLIGGLRVQRTNGDVFLPYAGDYTLSTSHETDFGYVLGIAWEKPEIAARVALTYNSAITHAFDAVESSAASGFANLDTTFKTEIPQSVNLEFQTGVAADTLLFGSIRWVDWTAFEIAPEHYTTTLAINPSGEPLVFYTNDVVTYNLGLGRRFNDTWSGAVLVGYEKHQGDPVGNLGPKDGYASLGLAATYTKDNMKITGGVRYVDIGNATTRNIGGDFRNNSGWGAGLRIGVSF